MQISNKEDLEGMKRVSEAVAITLKEMINYTKVGMSTKQIDHYGAQLLGKFGANSAPRLTYNFPGNSCISVNNEFCHGIPSAQKILQEGDLINIDVSAELAGFWSDNGCSFVVGEDIHQHQGMIDASKQILKLAIAAIKGGVKIATVGELMETEAKKRGYMVIKNLGGHGIGRSLHEQPDELLNFKNRFDQRRFKKDSVVAIETFVATASTYAVELEDGWTMVGNKGGVLAQHEHTLIVTAGNPTILTADNGVWD
ncbi:type I methionyl aminopeptidase [Sphingobacterium sp. DK4209]|uniref:Methionine aminopeptidase n=1 Tax=Sphingobacterium zhuxiongii TaxID=2662364 RepID=A0A5Q0QHB6_9SPHI|nr:MULTISPECIES: type I methionyl aminopeptidase [unclassified Sphingobacterium]MVZ66606.1 type I methionyl aminopeptidase [Sphingobacterium sp. DK4209]QGA26790.1 type I methionyl aminopeptidase [Sphingobacterium sp. dk4302]